MSEQEKKEQARKKIAELTLKIEHRHELNDRDARKIRELMRYLNGRL